jgi:tetratricopeptide (TPR) repeat protein/2-polyprenyl-3-methyl-5-hydroxy-6-metoxy-1,4-benzoquinol methylase
MKHKQRRGAGRRQSAGEASGLAIQRMFADALRHHQAGRLVDAAHRYRRILAVNPRDYPEVHMNLGLALLQQGKLDEAATSYKEALELRPNDVEGLLNLGNILGDLGKPDEAIACYRKALVISPDFPDVHNSLGATLYGLGMLDEAVASYRRALEIRPDFVMALNNLAATLTAQGKPAAALNIARRSLQVEETDETKGLLVSCLSRARGVTADAGLRPLMVRALSEHWGWPSSLMPVCIDLIRLDHDIAGQASFDAAGLAALGADPLLSALLDAAPICDVGMEHFLTAARRALLDAAPETSGWDGIAFYSALARQCFINEYVFAATVDEASRASDLRDALSAALETDAAVPTVWLPAVAAYFPLCSLPSSARLLERSWPTEITALLTQQVREPAEEHRIGTAIARLTAIEDGVSLLVQRQYEENPYPRWVKVPPSAKADSIEVYLRRTFPLAAFDRPPASSRMEVLVAGCGTGQQSIRASRQFPEARILAIDLSRSSLAYAVRKTRELNISSIEYAQADLLNLGSLGRQFDVIQAGGVLHHLADPWTGWRTLLSLLRPGGFMLLGLYSSIARRDVTRLRQFIAEQGYGTTADEIRRCRQDLTAAGGIGSADGRPSDLFTISGVRDLLFHIQEHPVTLAEIARFLEENDLAFLGFDISADVLQSYRSRFPADRAATNLAQWQLFENENPDTFVGMYQFWIQKSR